MARLKAGLIVTEIKGKLGGVTFRETPNGMIVSKKSRGASLDRTQKNSALAILSSINKEFSFLNQSEKKAWETVAKRYPYVDSFGDNRHLTGRGVFVKLTSNLKFSNGIPPGVSKIDSFQNLVKINQVKLQVASVKQIIFDSIHQNTYARIQVVRVNSSDAYFNDKRNKILATVDLSANSILDFTTAFAKRFSYAKENDIYQVKVTICNSSGFVQLLHWSNVILVKASYDYSLRFKHTSNNYMSWPLKTFSNNWFIESKIKITSLTNSLYFAFGSTGLILLLPNGSMRLRGSLGVVRSTAVNIFPIGQLFIFRLEQLNGVFSVLIDGVVKYTIAVQEDFSFVHMMYQYALNGVIDLYNLNLNGQLFDFDLGTGNKLIGDDSGIFTLRSNNNVNDMWIPAV